MKTRIVIGTIVLGMAGCSGSESPTVAVAVKAVTPVAEFAAHTPSIAPPETSPAKTEPVVVPKQVEAPPVAGAEVNVGDPKRPATRALDISELFAPPKEVPVIKPPEPAPVILPPSPVEVPKPVEATVPPPPLRLIGFTETDRLKALLSVDGKLNLLAAGESSEGIEVVSLDPPVVTLRHADKEFEIDLIAQPWSEISGTPQPGLQPGMNPLNRPLRMPGIPPSRTVPAPPTRPSNLKDAKNWAAAPIPPGIPPLPSFAPRQ